MAQRGKQLSTVKQIDALREPGLYGVSSDAGGLYLKVNGPDNKSWIWRYNAGRDEAGKPVRRAMGLGAYPATTLEKARQRALELRDEVKDGSDPIQAKKEREAEARAEALLHRDFRSVADAYVKKERPNWRSAKHADQWTSTLERYAYPTLGDLPVNKITTMHIVAVLKPIWDTKRETASRLRGRIEVIIENATPAERLMAVNPASRRAIDRHLTKDSRRKRITHHPALHYEKVGELMRRIRERKGVSYRALELALLTAKRSQEVRCMRWDEVDLDKALWIIPKDRMKSGVVHREPLSTQAVELLRATPYDEKQPLVFPGIVKNNALSDMSLTVAIRRLWPEEHITVHGTCRATFRTWIGECTAFPHEVAEFALSHGLPDATVASYQRSDMLPQRAKLMAAWSNFLDKPPAKAKVVSIHAKRGSAGGA